MVYVGVGSRKTPAEILKMFSSLAKYLGEQGYVLRSGGASGADQAFERGCDAGDGIKEIYLPWKDFEKSNSSLVVEPGIAYEIAEKFHPAWSRLSDGAKKLQARNSHQVLGADCKTPADFIICWTLNGEGGGGTGQAIRIAKAYNIPICDCGLAESIDKARQLVWHFLQSMDAIGEIK